MVAGFGYLVGHACTLRHLCGALWQPPPRGLRRCGVFLAKTRRSVCLFLHSFAVVGASTPTLLYRSSAEVKCFVLTSRLTFSRGHCMLWVLPPPPPPPQGARSCVRFLPRLSLVLQGVPGPADAPRGALALPLRPTRARLLPAEPGALHTVFRTMVYIGIIRKLFFLGAHLWFIEASLVLRIFFQRKLFPVFYLSSILPRTCARRFSRWPCRNRAGPLFCRM